VTRNGKTLFGDIVARITNSAGYLRDFLRIRGDDGIFEFENDVEIAFPSTSGTLALLSDVTEAVTILTKSASYAMATGDYFINSVGSSDTTLTLPPLSGLTVRPRIIKNSGTAVVTLDGSGAETIDGATTFRLSPLRSVTLYPTATGWLVT
jgi:hypothetical protein